MKYLRVKNNLNIYIKLVFILVLFAVSLIINKVYASTISFETYGGTSVADITKEDGEEIGILPVPSKSGKIFEGWYLEDTFDTRVSSSYEVNGDVELKANFVTDNFPIVWKKLQACIFNGKDHNISGEDCTEYSNGKYIDTGIMLYDNTNHGLDYEIGFKIEHYDPDEQDENIPQQTFMNTKLEGSNYPGLVFRRNADKVELASRRTTSANSSHQEEYANWTDVRIYRIDKVIYYSVNEVEKHDLNGLYTFNPEFELNVWFGAAPKNEAATIAQRFLNGTLSNMYIKVGDYEEKDNYKVYKPDGTIDEVEKYSDYLLENVDYSKDDENLNSVTYVYHDGRENTVDYVKKEFIPNGWYVYDDKFEDTDTFRVLKDTVLYPDYVEDTVGVDLPTITRDHYEFLGWYTEEEGGEQVTSYSGNQDIVVHAHWESTLPTDFDVDDLSLFVGDTKQIDVTFTPNDKTDTLLFSDYDTDKISIVNGEITALQEGETTVTVGLQNVPNVTKIITVTIESNELKSNVYEVREASGNNDRIVIGADAGTTIGDFKNNMLNSNEYIKIYDSNNNELTSSDIVKTGLIIKLEYDNNTLDEAIMVIRGDTNGDGIVTVVDYMKAKDVAAENDVIEEYPEFVAVDIQEDEIITVADYMYIMDYVYENINSLNE